MSEPNPDSKSAANASPVPGCVILAVIVLVFGGLIVLYTGVGLWMNKQIDQFTDDEPRPVPEHAVTEDQTRLANDKLEMLLDAAISNRMERFTFNADELNTLITSQSLTQDFIGNAYIVGISEEGIQTRVSQEMRSIKPGSRRYLNGDIYFVPLLRRNSIVFQIRDLKVPDKEVPREFIESYSSQDLFKIGDDNPEIEPVLRQLEKAYLEDGHLVLETRRDIATTPEP